MRSKSSIFLLFLFLYGLLAIDCGPPPDVENADAEYVNSTIGDEARYACREGYESTNDSSVGVSECRVNDTLPDTGSWLHPNITCIGKTRPQGQPFIASLSLQQYN